MADFTNILNELNELGADALIKADRKNYFFVPDGYFSGFAGNVMAHLFINSLPAKTPYALPEDYFRNFSRTVLDKVNSGVNVSFSNLDKDIYTVPDGYFNSLAENILKKIKTPVYNSVQQELEEVAPLLNKIPKVNVYSVPENYFNNINYLPATEAKKQPAKVVSFGSRTRRWINYAAAASIAAVLFGGGYLFINKPEKAIIENPNVDVRNGIAGLTDDQISDYLDSSSNMNVYTSPDDDGQNMDIQDLLHNCSDEEIQQYLNLHQGAELAEDGGGI